MHKRFFKTPKLVNEIQDALQVIRSNIFTNLSLNERDCLTVYVCGR